MSDSDTACFVAENLSARFDAAARTDARSVFEGVSFTIGRGEFVSIVGGSGVGKTTLLRVLGGLHPAGSGSRLTYAGQPLSGAPRGVVTVFQDYAASLLPWRTVGRNVALGLPRGLARSEVADRVGGALDMVGLADYARHYPSQLSGGMQQRVQIARALVTEPQALLMDEPFGALDAMTKTTLQDVLLDIQARTQATVVFVTHDIDEAIYLSDRVFFLSGSPAALSLDLQVGLARPRNQVETKESPRYLKLRHDIYSALNPGLVE